MTTPHDASRGDAPVHVLPIRDSWQSSAFDEAIRSVVAAVASERRRRRLPVVEITIDTEGSLGSAADDGAVNACLAPIVALACDAACAPARASDGPRLREVAITTFGSPRGLEIEVADSGPGPEYLPADALERARTEARRFGGGLVVAACPEGGAAVTLCLPPRLVSGQSLRPAA